MVQSIHLNLPNNVLTIFGQDGVSPGKESRKEDTIESVKIITDLFWSLSLLEQDYRVDIKITPKENNSGDEECLFKIIKGFYKRNYKLMSIVRHIAEKKVFPEAGAMEKLSPMQKKIALHIHKGMSYTNIAKKLNLSPHTVNGHRKNVMKVLGVSKMKGLISYLERFAND